MIPSVNIFVELLSVVYYIDWLNIGDKFVSQKKKEKTRKFVFHHKLPTLTFTNS